MVPAGAWPWSLVLGQACDPWPQEPLAAGSASPSLKGRYVKLSPGRMFASPSPAVRTEHPPTSHQSPIGHPQPHSQQWSLWKPGPQGRCWGAGELMRGWPGCHHPVRLPWSAVGDSQHLRAAFRPPGRPSPCLSSPVPRTCPFCLLPRKSCSSAGLQPSADRTQPTPQVTGGSVCPPPPSSPPGPPCFVYGHGHVGSGL